MNQQSILRYSLKSFIKYYKRLKKQMKNTYYPELQFIEVKEGLSIALYLETNIRFKHEKGFYYIVKLKQKIFLDESFQYKKELKLHQLYQRFIKEVENCRNNHVYNPDFKTANPIDKYQGELDAFNPTLVFGYYDPNLSFEELLERNKYTKDFILN